MGNKLPGCKTCPSYTQSQNMVWGEYRESKVCLLRSSIDDNWDSLRPLLGIAGIGHIEDLTLDTAVRCKGEHTKEAIAHCHKTYFNPPDCTELVIAIGLVAAKVMGMEGKMEQWRGHVLES